MNRVDEANRLVDEGQTPIPLVGKHPAIKNYWLYEPTWTNNRFWFTRHNLGLLLAGLVVIDVDSPAGEIWYRSHVGSLDPPHQTIVQATRGRHYYWKPPPGVEMSKIQLPGVDILTGPRVTVTLPPSIHASGKPYEYLSRCPFAELPEIHMELAPKVNLAPKLTFTNSLVSKKRESVRRYIARIVAISGQRGHNATFRAACKLRDAGLTTAEALEDLWAWNEAGNAEPPWSFKEIEHKIASAYERGKR